MRRAMSLRLRLFVLILTPLVLMACLLGYWRVSVAQATAQQLYDRSLLSAALAISRDVAVSGGDVLKPTTRNLIRDSSGGEVFYHATGPGGIYVTGYAYPPIEVGQSGADRYAPAFFEASYRGEPVRVLRITEQVSFENLTGDATVTVWQRLSDRNAFARKLGLRAAGLMGGLLGTLALVVWFGVQLGLRPLLDLQQAIAMRSPGDLSQIRRAVPAEVQGIVSTLNRLFRQVETSIQAQQVFISDAAHQLRNPAAAVQSMAESVRDAATAQDRNTRIGELVTAARASARVADQLLSLDRLRQPVLAADDARFDVGRMVEDICADMGPAILSKGLDFELRNTDGPTEISGDRVFVAEAIKNLIDNALKHGGPALTSIVVAVTRNDGMVRVTVSDDGKALTPEQSKQAFNRFSQIEPSDGSGLGLAIAASVADRHNGTLEIDRVETGASLTLSLPLVA